jgi:hypothetical protein
LLAIDRFYRKDYKGMFDHKIMKIAPESDLDKPILIAEKLGNDRLFTAI